MKKFIERNVFPKITIVLNAFNIKDLGNKMVYGL